VDGHGAFERISEACTVNRLHYATTSGIYGTKNDRDVEFSGLGDYFNTSREPKLSATECGYASKEICAMQFDVLPKKRIEKRKVIGTFRTWNIFSLAIFTQNASSCQSRRIIENLKQHRSVTTFAPHPRQI